LVLPAQPTGQHAAVSPEVRSHDDPLGGLLPVLGMAVIAAFIPCYRLPIRGEIAGAQPWRDGRGLA
jgi:hypothetical protein